MSNDPKTTALDAERIANAKRNALALALEHARAKVVEFRALGLVDLQGLYLQLYKVLTGINFPLESGLVIGKFAALQINEIFREIPLIVQRKYGQKVGILKDLIDEIRIETINGKSYLKQAPKVLQDGIYVDVQPSFEVFYALPDMSKIAWHLRREANKGSAVAKSQLRAIESGILRTKHFERNYKHFPEFVNLVKGDEYCNGSEEGFFSYMVNADGLNRFDEKEVDVRIALRAMESLYEKQTDALCIISSDQDFIPIKGKCDKHGVEFFQADSSKFVDGEHVGKKIVDLSESFIRGTFKPEWPFTVLSEFIRPKSECGSGRIGLTKNEVRALVSFHNMINEWKIEIVTSRDGKEELRISRPLESDVDTRVDGRTMMKQVRITRLEY